MYEMLIKARIKHLAMAEFLFFVEFSVLFGKWIKLAIVLKNTSCIFRKLSQETTPPGGHFLHQEVQKYFISIVQRILLRTLCTKILYYSSKLNHEESEDDSSSTCLQNHVSAEAEIACSMQSWTLVFHLHHHLLNLPFQFGGAINGGDLADGHEWLLGLRAKNNKTENQFHINQFWISFQFNYSQSWV